MLVILISGKAQSGKDTAAKMIQRQLKLDNYRVLIVHFADLLKHICRIFFGWNGAKDKNGRKMLQYVGTDVIRKQNPNFWVDFVAMMLRYFYENWDYVIIPDCRFPNELSEMTDNGFEAVHLRVVRSNYDSLLSAEQHKHPSETALDNITPDYYIKNDGTLEDLENLITKWIKEKLYANKTQRLL